MSLATGSSSTLDPSGNLSLASGAAFGLGDSGDFVLATGSTQVGHSGNLSLNAGRSASGAGGNLRFVAGNSESLGPGGGVSVRGGNGGSDSGGDVTVTAGSNGLVAVQAADQVTGLTVSEGSIALTAGIVNGNGVGEQIGFGFRENGIATGDASSAGSRFDVRIQHNVEGDTKLISNVPFMLTSVDYSSDVRIKRRLAEADTDELLQRIQQVEYKRYRYTDAWRGVRGIDDVEVTSGMRLFSCVFLRVH